MNTTENLGLRKPELDDSFRLDDWNHNTDALDAFAGRVDAEMESKANADSVYTKAETSAVADASAAAAINDLDVPSATGDFVKSISQVNGKISTVMGTLDDTPTAGSDKPVKSKGVKSYVDNAVAGKITKAEFLGVGTSIQENADLDDFATPGVYSAGSNAIAASIAHCPTPNGFRLEVLETISSSAYRQQWLYPNNSAGEFFIRRQITGGWSNWFRFAGTEIIPT